MCLYPTLIKNRKYTKTKKNEGQVPSLPDRRIEYIPVGCGNCKECRKQKKREWQVRLGEDIKTNTNAKFITLTFSNESIKEIIQQTIKKTNQETGKIEQVQIQTLKGYQKDNAIATRAIRLFNERYRKKYKKAIRHWLVTELGHKGTENIHIHGIVWLPTLHEWEKQLQEITQIWQYGFTWIGYKRNHRLENYVNAKTVNYIVKYINKIDQRNKEYKPIILTSAGIGQNYINTQEAKKNKFNNRETNELYKTRTGYKLSLPIYYRNKLYTEEEKEQLWIGMLDKEERWINGIRYDISKGEEKYKRALLTAKEENRALGYGGKPNENRKQYEDARRDILNETRIRKAKPPAG